MHYSMIIISILQKVTFATVKLHVFRDPTKHKSEERCYTPPPAPPRRGGV